MKRRTPTRTRLLGWALLLAIAPALAAATSGPRAPASALPSLIVLSGGGALTESAARVSLLDARRSELAREREALEEELDALAKEIVDLKGRRHRVRADAELTRRLQRSRELSAAIDELSLREAATKKELRSQTAGVIALYEAEVASKRAKLEELTAEQDVDHARVKEALSFLATSEERRRAVEDGLARLDEHADSALDGEAERMSRLAVVNDDPEELRARADMMRDTGDRLARRIADLERQARSVETRRELERDLHGFLSESRLFDEGDRATARLVTADSAERPVGGATLEALTSGQEESATDWEPAVGDDPPESPPSWDGDGGGFDAPGGGDEVTPPPHEDPEPLSRLERIATRADGEDRLEGLLGAGEGGSLDEIREQAAELARLIRRLEGRAAAFERRAAQIEARER